MNVIDVGASVAVGFVVGMVVCIVVLRCFRKVDWKKVKVEMETNEKNLPYLLFSIVDLKEKQANFVCGKLTRNKRGDMNYDAEKNILAYRPASSSFSFKDVVNAFKEVLK